MSSARRLRFALGLVAMTAALAAAFLTANVWLYALAGLVGVGILIAAQTGRT